MTKKFRVAVVGATGAVGNQMITCLEEADFPVSSIRLLASSRSVGKTLAFHGKPVPVEELTEESLSNLDIALFSAGGSISKKFAPIAAEKGCIVIDNSSAFRQDPEIPLVVPEVNPEDIPLHKGIISNPNCSTIQMVVALKPLYDMAGIRRIVVSTYQAVSGTGQKAIQELSQQTNDLISGKPVRMEVYPYQIAFNCLPHIDVFLENGYTREEMKMVNETKKIMHDDSILVTATTVRVPVFYGHSESVNVELREKLTAAEARKILRQAPGVRVIDNPEKNEYPLAIYAAGCDLTLVGRIREDNTVKYGLNLWIVADNIRKGAATNAVQIATILAKNHL